MQLDSLISRPNTQRSWSSYQKAIFDHAEHSPGESLVVQAVAGSGKSTTLVELTNRIKGSSIFLAFNKSIATDLASKISNAQVKTLNALGHSIVTKAMKGIQLDSYKTSNALKDALSAQDFKDYSFLTSKLISLAKANGLGIEKPFSANEALAIMGSYELYAENPDKLAAIAIQSFPQLVADQTSMDFDDQLYYPIFHQLYSPTFDNVLVDEAQDLSPIQHTLIQAVKGSRIIAVGDRAQAIYGFRGAAQSSMDDLKKALGAQELPLSICYRCPRQVILEAQTIVPWIEAAPGAPEGLVTTAIEPGEETTLVLCRANAPLFSLAMNRLKKRLPTRLLTSWADQIPRFLRGFKCVRASDLAKAIDKWCDEEIRKATERCWENRINQLHDRRAALLPLCEEFKLAAEVINFVETLFQSKDGLILSTIHKAKGLESPHVFILSPSLLNDQRNLHYVAITRAQQSLTYQEELS